MALVLLKIAAPPSLAVVPELTHKGAYHFSTISIRPDADCGVLVHEMAHHKQFSKKGPATDWDEWLDREQEALRIERSWRRQ